MRSDKDMEMVSPDRIWIISKGRYTDMDMNRIKEGMDTGPVKEYRISDLARYMLNPDSIEVDKALIGCEVHFHQQSSRIGQKIGRLLHRRKGNENAPTQTLLSDFKTEPPSLKDEDLESYIDKIYSQLKPYDPTLKRLLGLDQDRISDVVGICEEDIDGNRSWLTLKGGMDEKINYICNFIGEDVGVILDRALVADGLFELRGFDFTSYDPGNSYRLLRFYKDGMPRSCVLGPGDKVEFWIEDRKLITYMQLLEQAIRTNPKFNDSLNRCIEGNAKPLRLLFNGKIEIDYSRARLPQAYKEVFDTYDMESEEKERFMDSLKKNQIGISFQLIPQSRPGKERLFTNISVMHDFRALEPIKENLPQLYSEIDKKAAVSEAGKFYLLDSIRGYKNG
jgi:hypothetical protein